MIHKSDLSLSKRGIILRGVSNAIRPRALGTVSGFYITDQGRCTKGEATLKISVSIFEQTRIHFSVLRDVLTFQQVIALKQIKTN